MKLRNPWLCRALIAISVTQLCHAAVYNWNGSTTGGATGASNAWDTTSANWTGDGAVWPATTTSDDDAVFAGTAGTVTIATGGVTANDLSFSTTGYTVAGAALSLNGTTPTVTTALGVTTTISSVVSGSAGLTKSGAGTLVLSGANNFSGVANVSQGTLRLGNAAALGVVADGTTVSDGATLDINAQNTGTEVITIAGSGVNNAGALINNGGEQTNALGRLVLGANATIGGTGRFDLRNNTPTLNLAGFTLTKTGANYLGLVGVTTTPGAGNIVINQGEISAQTTTTLAGDSTNTVTVNNGGTMGMWQSTVPHLWKLNLNSGGTLRAQSSTVGTQNQWNGPVEISGDATFFAEGFMTLGGALTGTGNVIKTGASTTTFGSTSSLGHTGNVVVNAGNLTISGVSSFVGSTTVNGGVLNLTYGSDDNSKLPDDQPLILAGGTLSLIGGTHTEQVGSVVLQANTSSAINFSSRAGGFFALNNVTRQTGASLNVQSLGTVTTDLLNTNGIIGPWMTFGGNMWAINSLNAPEGDVSDLQDFYLSSDPALSDIAAGYENRHVLVDSSQTPDAGINPLSLIFNTATVQTLTLQGANTIATGGILIGATVAANATTINGGTITGPANGELVIHQRGTGAVSIGSSIVNNGVTSLVKMGTGTLTLSGNNTYTGQTVIANGILQVASSTALGGTHVLTPGLSGTGVQLQNGVTVGSGNTITISGPGIGGFFGALSTTGTAEWNGNVIIGTPTGTRIGTAETGTGLAINGVISEPAGVPSELNIRSGAAAVPVTLGGANTFTGNVSIVTGTLRLTHSQALGLGNKNFNMQGVDRRLELSGGISLGSNITLNLQTNTNAGVLSTLGDNSIQGNINLTGGGTSIGSNTGSSLSISGNILGASGNQLNLYGTSTADNVISGAIGNGTSATVALVKEQAGTWRLSGNNSFSGAVTVTSGRLIAASENALGAAGKTVNVNSGGTLELAMDGAMPSYSLNTSTSAGNATLVINRATSGAAPTRQFDNYTLGNCEMIFQAGANIASGTPTVQINSLAMSAGVAGGLNLARLTPNGVNVQIGNLQRSGANAGALVLAGNSTGNIITGVVSNGSAGNYTITKDDTGTWELAGANTYTGALTVRRGTLTLSGNRTNASLLGGILVADTAGQNATLNISNGTHNLAAASEFRIASTTVTPVTGTVNQSGGQVSIAAGTGNQMLIGASSVANRGIYNLSGGSITIGLSTNAGRGVMLGVNTGASGGTFNLSGTGTLNMTLASGGTGDATLAIGRHDSAANNTNNTFNQTGGTANVGILSMGGVGATSTGVTSQLSITGGTFRANQFPRMAAGNTNTATVVIGGTADVTLPAFPTARGTSSTATLTFDGGTLRPSAASATYISGLTNAFIRSGGAHISSAVEITIPQILRVDPASTGGGFTKSGSGRVNLTAANTYNGTTTVNEGILSLGNGTTSTTLADSADVSIASGATLNLNYSGTDTIDELIINGQRRTAGVWGSATSGAPNIDPALTGAGTLTVTTGPSAVSDFTTWANSYTPPVGLASADDDGDGLSNFHEYAFGLDPKSAASANPISQPLDKATGTFKYTRRATPATSGVSYSYESSTTLSGTWPSLVPTSEVSNNATPIEEVTVTVPSALLAEPKLFLRVNASQNQ